MTIEIPKKEPLNIVPFIDRKNARPSVRMMWSPILGQRIGDHLYGT